MVYWPTQAILIWIEHAKKFFEFGLLLTKLGRNLAHLALEFAYFHSAPSPIESFFIAPPSLEVLPGEVVIREPLVFAGGPVNISVRDDKHKK
jgi:hypothetical protein